MTKDPSVEAPPLDTADLLGQIARFIARPRSQDFDALARRAFDVQYRRLEPYRALCQGRGRQPEDVQRWQDVPPLPIAAFKSFALHLDEPREVFRSSGTTGPSRSVHRHPYPDLYRTTIDHTFPRFCLPSSRPAMLSLVPSRRQAPDSSLGFMVDHVIRRFGSDASRYAFAEGGVDTEAAAAWCREQQGRERQRQGEPVLILATAFALLQWLEDLERDGVRFVLPEGSVVFETGGFKGRVRQIARAELLERVERSLAVPPSRVVREYGMTELTGQFYTRVLAGGDPDLFHPPPFMRVRLLDPATLQPLPPGEPGLICIFDLSNVGSAIHLLTEDLGIADGEGFRLLGRAGDAELRGCSLSVEELAFDPGAGGG